MKDYFKLKHGLGELLSEYGDRRSALADRKSRADELCADGQVEQAISEYTVLLEQDEGNPELWWALGNAQARQGNHDKACVALLRSIECDTSSPGVHAAFGQSLRALAEPNALCDAYLTLLGVLCESSALDDDTPPTTKTAEERLGQALRHCRQSLGTAERADQLHTACGHLAMVLQRMDDAVKAYEAAVDASPDDLGIYDTLSHTLASALESQGDLVGAHLARGRAHYWLGRYKKAIAELALGVVGERARSADYAALAEAHNRLAQYDAAEHVCRSGLARFPAAPFLYGSWVSSLLARSQTEEAVQLAERAARELQDPLFQVHARCLSLPAVYTEPSQVEEWRAKFVLGMDRLVATVEENWQEAIRRPDDIVRTNFYLHYQACDDTALLARHGALIHRLLGAAYPAWSARSALPSDDQQTRIRVGYLSPDLRMHSVGKIVFGWLAYHDRTQFEVFTYLLHTAPDALARQFAAESDHFRVLSGSIEEVATRVAQDRLHILVHPGIGMYSVSTQLAALHLAPIQCAAWGHPVTTGLPSIDYFISNELMEPPNASEHYTESLVRLPKLGVHVPPPYVPQQTATRTTFDLPNDAVLYLSAQPEIKYLPQHDALYARIARSVPEARLVVILPGPEEIRAVLRRRLEESFAAHGLEPARRLIFMTRLLHRQFLELNRLCDVFLDTIGWSGGISTLDALGCGLPVVTCPGAFFRGRQSYGMLRALGIEETIAKDPDEYVEIAVRLGRDPELRSRLRSSILERRDRLFNDTSCIRALEAFYRRAVSERAAMSDRGDSPALRRGH